MTYVNNRDAAGPISRLEIFENSTGSFYSGRYIGNYGILPKSYWDALGSARGEADFYVVYSYETPIGWYAGGEWTVPNVKYSVTTSRHQSALNMGIFKYEQRLADSVDGAVSKW